MSNSPLANIPLIQQNQSSKYITHNQAIAQIEALLGGVLNGLNTPPVSPSEGDRYLIIATATGLWTGKEDNIAEWINGAWAYYPPFNGLFLFNLTAVDFYYYNNGWLSVSTTGIANLIEDTSPQLGGDLDVNNFAITNSNPSGIITFNSPVYFAKTQDMGFTDLGSGTAIDLSLNNLFIRDAVAGDITFTINNCTTLYHQFKIRFTYTSGTITWFSGIDWDGGSQPTINTTKKYTFLFETYDGGTTWDGCISYTNSAT